VLTDVAASPSWDSRVASVDGRLAPGEKLRITVEANPGRAFPVKVVTLSEPDRKVFRGGMPLGPLTPALLLWPRTQARSSRQSWLPERTNLRSGRRAGDAQPLPRTPERRGRQCRRHADARVRSAVCKRERRRSPGMLVPFVEAVSRRGHVRGVSDHSSMPQNFIESCREQGFLLPPDVRDWLAPDHLGVVCGGRG
jgi:hypothetical protein